MLQTNNNRDPNIFKLKTKIGNRFWDRDEANASWMMTGLGQLIHLGQRWGQCTWGKGCGQSIRQRKSGECELNQQKSPSTGKQDTTNMITLCKKNCRQWK